MPLLSARGLRREVRLPDGGRLEILRHIDLDVEPGEHVAIVGRSGTGKSTLLNLLGLLDRPSEGSYRLGETDLLRLSEGRRARLRGERFGFVFQQFNLLAGRSALANVTTPLLYARGASFFRRTEVAEEILHRVGLGERLDSTADQLSGGEQQRVAIARALVRQPQVILADEPTGALDVDTGDAVMSLLEEQAGTLGTALITITHDRAVAARADRVLRLDHGVLGPEPVARPEPVAGPEPVARPQVVQR